MKFDMNMFLDNRMEAGEFQADGSKVKVTWVLLVYFCVHNAAATGGQYLALSKAWRSCLFICLLAG